MLVSLQNGICMTQLINHKAQKVNLVAVGSNPTLTTEGGNPET
jgi:hypothetical protein